LRKQQAEPNWLQSPPGDASAIIIAEGYDPTPGARPLPKKARHFTRTQPSMTPDPGNSLPLPPTPPPRSLSPAQRRILLTLAGLAVLVTLVVVLSNVLAPFLLATLLAYAVNPAVEKLEAKRLPRAVASALAIIVITLLVFGLVLVVVPLFFELAGRLSEQLPRWLETLRAQVLPWAQRTFGVGIMLDTPHLTAFLQEHAVSLQALFGRALSSLTAGGLSLINWLVYAFLVPILFFYLLVDWKMITRGVDDLIPRRWHIQASSMLDEIDAVLGQFLRGQLSVMLLLSLFYVVALAAAGLEFALPVGVITGLLIFIPYLGFGLGMVLAVATALLQDGPSPLLWVAVIYVSGQALESFFLTPWLVGERIGLHPAAVIFALLAFGQLFGFTGLLLALPATAALVVALRAWREFYLTSEYYRQR
jgi:predicted PurR-regulated permease PerM